VAVAAAAPAGDALWTAFRADLAATFVIFGFSFVLGNSSMYDPYWSVAPPLIVGSWIVAVMPAGDLIRQGLLLMVVVAWGTRLTLNWQRGWTGLGHEDWRYVQIREQVGLLYWPVSLFGLHLFPTLIVFAGLWPAWEAVRAEAPWRTWELVGPAVALGGMVVEGTADRQLAAFRERAAGTAEVIREGLWRWSRHPNYVGEMMFWWGLWLTAVGADLRNAVTAWGALAMTAMFRFVSVPLMEERMLRRRPPYRQVIEEVPMFLPGMGGRS